MKKTQGAVERLRIRTLLRAVNSRYLRRMSFREMTTVKRLITATPQKIDKVQTKAALTLLGPYSRTQHKKPKARSRFLSTGRAMWPFKREVMFECFVSQVQGQQVLQL